MTCSVLPASFPAVSPRWSELAEWAGYGSIFLTPRWQQSWWSEFGGDGLELCVILVGQEDAPQGLAPLMRRGDTLAFIGDTELFDYHDFVLAKGAAADFYATLVTCLRDEPWRTLDLRSILEGSPTLRYLPELCTQQGYRVSVEQEDVSPGLRLPSTWEEYLDSLRKKDRHELRRKLRRLAEEGEYRLVRSTPESLSQDLDLLLELMGESREEKRLFLTPARQSFFRRVTQEMQEAGYLRLFFLELAGQRVAGALCFDYAGRRLLYNSGYRLEQSGSSVGLMLKVLCLQQAMEEGLSYFDFLRGREPYKYHLGAQDVPLHRLVVQR